MVWMGIFIDHFERGPQPGETRKKNEDHEKIQKFGSMVCFVISIMEYDLDINQLNLPSKINLSSSAFWTVAPLSTFT